ncbi:hypothetical protein [Micromonospora qiuiae]|uniref:hypothetical protein n=1 Tax=Micromonospora qiuiae TaxID=502268 RepID=UPI001951212F|nr:hypothetical protein [Micromonospora qiuiae]
MIKSGWVWLIAVPLAAAWALFCVVPGVRVAVDVAWAALDLPRSGHARHYLDQVQANQGYENIGWGSEGNCQCNLAYHYVGPADVDPGQIFEGPDLALAPLTPTDSVSSRNGWQRVLSGHGEGKQSGRCRVELSRYALRDLERPNDWRLSKSQRDDFTAGKLDILELYVDCEYDHRSVLSGARI